MLTWFRWTTLMIALAVASYYGYRVTPWSCMDVTVTAYWVQAIGSITAIFGAYLLGERQSKKAIQAALDLRNHEQRSRLASIFAICNVALDRTELVYRIFCQTEKEREQRFFKYDHSLLRGVVTAIDAIPFHEIGNASAVIAILELRDQLQFLMPCIDAFEKLGGISDIESLTHRAMAQDQHIQNCRANTYNHVLGVRERHEILKSIFIQEI